ncbi:MAG: hypothetical protein HGA54_09595 [Actinobacteria bacterium]|nr:hypothetical protein [Actinomycetota bacterium]
MNILVFNANAGQFPIQLRKKYPSARIICCEFHEGYEGWLQKIGFETCRCYKYVDGKKVLDFGELRDMKFDLIAENPPYNDSKGGSNGTAGNTTLYKKFRSTFLTMLKPNGKLVMVCPKGILRDLYDSPNQVEVIDLMTETDHWSYNTLHFVERNAPKTHEPRLSRRYLF